ncbi:MAG: MBL fold metallo-hydrolase [bacterium]|nr:MBL fold metallo-hydrolase [bacterium]
MDIKILASESLGVRSYCTYVKTESIKVIIDPGCALGPDRFNLPPHKQEVESLWECWERINKHLKECDVAIITHYHYDHHHYRNANLYEGKTLLFKDFSTINPRQKRRAEKFFEELKSPRAVIAADGRSFRFGKTEVEFTKALPHGYGREDIKVIGVYIKENEESIFYTSDISGVFVDSLVDFLKNKQITTLIFDGFPLYIKGSVLKNKWFLDSLKKLDFLIRKCNIKNLIIDHHSARIQDWKKYYEEILSNKNLSFVGTAAEFLKMQPKYLESMRRTLFTKK